MDALSITTLLFVLFFLSFFLGGKESALIAKKNTNTRINRLAKRRHSQSHLYSHNQAIPSLALVTSLLNASILAIYIILQQKVEMLMIILVTGSSYFKKLAIFDKSFRIP